jgi:2-methylcitrate dehydratase PrpD
VAGGAGRVTAGVVRERDLDDPAPMDGASVEPGASPTATLARSLVGLARRGLGPEVLATSGRSLLNVVGTAIGAARSDAVDAVLDYAASTGATGEVPVFGRAERLAPSLAALAFGVAAHYDDFDDTHLETVIHPGASSMGALLAVGVPANVDGTAALTAFALGIEGQLRIGSAISPSHYDLGWHITGTCGVLGSAITAGLLLGLDEEQLTSALGVAASMTVGVREGFGTMTKPYHPGRASANGVIAARYVAAGGDGPAGVLEASGGFVEALSDAVDWGRVTDGLGSRWELDDNTFKPYPCGIVSHPAIHAASRLHDRIGTSDRIERVTVRCHPLVPELTGNPDPQDGLQARFSTIHGVCAGLADGPVALPQYDDARVRSDDLLALRARTTLEVDPTVTRDGAIVEVTLTDGAVEVERVDHAPGSLARPLTDDELHAKVRALVEPILPGSTDAVIAAVGRLDGAAGLSHLCAVATGAATPDRTDR